MMTREEHRDRHALLHAHLRELTDCYQRHHPTVLLREVTVQRLLEWSDTERFQPTVCAEDYRLGFPHHVESHR